MLRADGNLLEVLRLISHLLAGGELTILIDLHPAGTVAHQRDVRPRTDRKHARFQSAVLAHVSVVPVDVPISPRCVGLEAIALIIRSTHGKHGRVAHAVRMQVHPPLYRHGATRPGEVSAHGSTVAAVKLQGSSRTRGSGGK